MGPQPPKVDPRAWEPEPLRVPAEPPPRKNRSLEETDDDLDLPGSHVVVIDLA
jgi:hypothetical protein